MKLNEFPLLKQLSNLKTKQIKAEERRKKGTSGLEHFDFFFFSNCIIIFLSVIFLILHVDQIETVCKPTLLTC